MTCMGSGTRGLAGGRCVGRRPVCARCGGRDAQIGGITTMEDE